ncbi:MAG TPA: hypothetical protein VMZ51_06145 [Acidimicrobiales bacterium]|nr:hypothetical protein [Acidimicrobiales bacterium]
MRKMIFIAPLAGLLAATSPSPAIGAPHGTVVSLAASSGSRQFFVENLAGSDLTSFSIDRNGAQPFRVRVVDANYGSVAEDYQISATLNNLYKDGDPTKAKIPSSGFSIGYGASNLSASGVSFPVEPSYILTGAVPSCTNLISQGGVLATLSTLSSLCVLLGTGGVNVGSLPVAGTVTIVVPTTSQLTSLASLPLQLSGATGGTFTSADYQNGIGAGDTSGTGAGTAVGLMTGTGGLTAGLLSLITGNLPLSSTPLTTADDAGARVPVANAVNALIGSTSSTTLSQLGQAIAGLGNLAQESAVLNQLTGTLQTPVLSNIKELTGIYASFPVLAAAATVPQSGTYSGTMTVTFVQTP